MNNTGLGDQEFEFRWRGKSLNGMANEMIVHGKIKFDYDKNKFMAHDLNGSDIVVYDDDSSVAAVKALLKWMQ